jgi:hypothetical protein
MAIMPCTRCGARYLGASNAAYCTVLDGGTRNSVRQKLCQPCWDELLEKLTAGNCEVVYGVTAHDEAARCMVCGEVRPSPTGPMFFVTAYPAKQERRDFASPLHEECALDSEGTFQDTCDAPGPSISREPVGVPSKGNGKK